MDYTPRYPQPFTLWQAVQLDVPIITEEIARLQNSLALLRETQQSLQEAIDDTQDPDFVEALEENTGVIGSQEERISILRMALAQKGIPVEAHCANGSQPAPAPSQDPTTEDEQAQPVPAASNDQVHTSTHNLDVAEIHVDEDGGVDL